MYYEKNVIALSRSSSGAITAACAAGSSATVAPILIVQISPPVSCSWERAASGIVACFAIHHQFSQNRCQPTTGVGQSVVDVDVDMPCAGFSIISEGKIVLSLNDSSPYSSSLFRQDGHTKWTANFIYIDLALLFNFSTHAMVSFLKLKNEKISLSKKFAMWICMLSSIRVFSDCWRYVSKFERHQETKPFITDQGKTRPFLISFFFYFLWCLMINAPDELPAVI